MKNIIIVFSVLANLARAAYFPTLNVSYGLAEEEVTVIHDIIVNQEGTRTAYSDGLKSLFYIFRKSAAELIFDLRDESQSDSTILAKAVRRVEDAIHLSYDSVVLVLGESCSTVTEVARNRAHDVVLDVLTQITTAMELARSGNYSVNQAAIEDHQATLRRDFTNLVGSFYESISTCQNTADSDTTAVIKTAREESFVNSDHLSNAIFNAIKVYAAAVDAKYVDNTLESEIVDFWSKALIGINAVVDHEFSTLLTLYLNAHLGTDGIVSALAVNQYSMAASTQKYQEMAGVIADTVRGYFRRIGLGLDDDGEDDFTEIDAALQIALTKIIAGDIINLATITAMYPDSAAEVAAAREALVTVDKEFMTSVFDLIEAAGNRSRTYSEILDISQTMTAAAISIIPDYATPLYNLYRNNQTWDNKFEVEFANLKQKYIDINYESMVLFFEFGVLLARAINEGTINKADFYALQNLLNSLNSVLASYSQILSATGVLALQANHAS